MKAIILYDVEGEDKESFDLMVQSRDIHIAVFRFLENDDWSANIIKRYKSKKNIDFDSLISDVKRCLYDKMDALHVTLDKLS